MRPTGPRRRRSSRAEGIIRIRELAPSPAHDPHAPPGAGAGHRPGAVLVIVGTRPEAIKLAPVILRLARSRALAAVVVNSGQHPDAVRSTLAGFGVALRRRRHAAPGVAEPGRHLQPSARPPRRRRRSAAAGIHAGAGRYGDRLRRRARRPRRGLPRGARRGRLAHRHAGRSVSRGVVPAPDRPPRGPAFRAQPVRGDEPAERRRSIRGRSITSGTPASTACANCSSASATRRAQRAPPACW